MHEDEWRVEVQLDDDEHGYSLGERLRALDLDDKARERLGRRVIVTRDGSRVFLYTRTEPEAEEAARVVRELLAEDELTAELSTTRWHPVEDAWKDASLSLPRTEAELDAERRRREQHERREAELEGSYDWSVNVKLPSRGEAQELERRLGEEGLAVDRRWSYVTIGVLTEEHASDLGSRLRSALPEEAEIWVEPNLDDVPGPPFVLIGSWR